MGLFNFKKRMEETENECCCAAPVSRTLPTEENSCCCQETSENPKENSCCCQGASEESNKVASACCCGAEGCNIKVLGAGCKSCHEQLENVKTVIANSGINATVEYVTDMEKIMAYGVMSMPAIVVNEKVVSMGKVLKTSQVEDLLKSLGCM